MLKKQLRNGDAVRITWSDGNSGIIEAKSRSELVFMFPENVKLTDIKRTSLVEKKPLTHCPLCDG